MWTRAELKANAKQVLRRTYWPSFLVLIIVGVLTGGQNGINVVRQLQDGFGFSFPVRMVLFTGAFSLIISIFITEPLIVGKNYFFLRSREYDPEIGNIFARFGGGNYMNVVVTMFMISLKVFLWSLLFIIPGIIKAYEYTFVPYILAENPEISQARAFEMSKDMTDGIKFQIFIFQLSFIGWYLLGALALGVGMIFVRPYAEASMAELYMAQRAKLMSNYSAAAEDFCGF